jgi:hypothetical protein
MYFNDYVVRYHHLVETSLYLYVSLFNNLLIFDNCALCAS